MRSEPLRDSPQITNMRHVVLARTRARLDRSRRSPRSRAKCRKNFRLLDLQEAAHALQEITGRRTSDDLLRHIFERFCIGK